MKEKPGQNTQKKSHFLFKSLFILLGVFVLLGVIVFNFSDIFVNYLFFKEVGQLDVYLKELTTIIKLYIPFFIVYVLLYAFVLKSLILKVRRTNEIKKISSSFLSRQFHWMFSLFLSFILSYVSATSLWMPLLEFLGKTSFGQSDPVFFKDISFFVFDLPLMQEILRIFVMNLVLMFVFTFMASLSTYAKDFKNARQQRSKDTFSFENNRFAKHIVQAVKNFFMQLLPMFSGAFRRNFLGLFALSFAGLAAWFYMQRFSLLYKSHSLGYGAYFTDVNIKIPMLTVIAVLFLVGALVLLFNLFVKVKLTGVCLWFVAICYGAMIIVGFVYQTYVVLPNEYAKERPYIENNIKATQQAYGLDQIEVRDFPANDTLTAQDIVDNTLTVENIPINDYLPTLSTYNSTQGIRPYYEFYDVDTDRYFINGKYTQIFLSARELNSEKLDDAAKNWINTHLKYTHGFGVAASKVNEVTLTGQPVLSLKDIPPYATVSGLSITQPRIYYGELTNEYCVVATASGEFDYPEGSANKENSYDGTGGIALTPFNKVLFAINEGTLKFLLSADITSSSKILINRNINTRVQTIAPFLKYDPDPYLVISEGKLYYIIDAMTTSSHYPYSQRYSKDEEFNYIRNSVKVVVDAYNGDVTFYKMTQDDPILNAYASIYPTLFTPGEEMSEDLRAHLRYSEEYFNIQAQIYQTYHMSDAEVFYNKEDLWKIATQYYQTSKEPVRVNSAYMIMKLPEREEEFMIMLPFTPSGKTNMIAWMSGICDGEDYGKLVLYQMPKQKLVYGPLQIEQRIDQDTTIAPQLTLLSQQGSSVLRGNMYTIPIEDSILYVEPIYVTASAENDGLPEVKKVIAAAGDKIVMEDSLAEALNVLFSADFDFGDSSSQGGAGEQRPEDEGQNASPQEPDQTQSDPDELIVRANELFNQAQTAQRNGDWALYGECMQELQKVLEMLKQLAQ